MRWALCVLSILLVTGCAPAPGEPNGRSGGAIPEPAPSASPAFVFSLSNGTPGAGASPPPPVQARPLAEAETKKLLARLPAQKKIPGLKQDFALRESSMPPPRTGNTEKQPFPPPVPPLEPPAAESGPLKVLRHAPEGDVEQVPQLSVTFSQPMVAVTSHAETVAKGVPVRLAPEPEGQWRWVGTRTLLFEPKGDVSAEHELHRLPMATEYTVEVPAGTASASGEKLAAAERWTFKTPPPVLESASPEGEPHPLEPLFSVRFNQDVVPSQVLSTVKVDHGVSVRLATQQEATEVPKEESKRWVFFKATAPLQPATHYRVTIGPGTPSAEGPLKTTNEQSFDFSTYARFKVEESRCGWNEDCRPLYPFYVRFNNPIDEDKFDPATVKVEPAIPGQVIEAQGDVLWIRGQTKGRTRYRVTLPAALPDTFGQTLGPVDPITFDVGEANPQLMAMGGQMVTMQAKDKPTFPVYCMNYKQLKVKVWAVQPGDWTGYLKALSEYNYERPFPAPGQKVVDFTQETGVKSDELSEVSVDLKSALKDGKGHAIVMVEPVTSDKYPPRVVTWVQVTDLGIDAATDAETMQVYVSSLADGKPISGARVDLSGNASGTTGPDGMAQLKLRESSGKVLVASLNGDTAMLPRSLSYWDQTGWAKVSQSDRITWYTFDDRKMYRPAEEVRIKGWMRRWQPGPKGDIAALESQAPVSYTLYDSLNNEISKGQAQVSKLGGFDITLKLPKTMNLGSARVDLSTSLGSSAHYFQVQEFRRPEFEVAASSEPDSCVVGESANAEVKASYYAGGGLPNAHTTWQVMPSQGSFQPPGRDEYSFGTWVPWWGMDDFYEDERYQEPQTFEARTDSSGVHRLKLSFEKLSPPRPMVVECQASVEDVNRQAWTASTSILVHPSKAYVGLKTPSTFVEAGKPIELDVLVCDLEGKAVAGAPIEVRAATIDYEYKKGRYQKVESNPQSFDGKSSGDQPSHFSLKTPVGGTYQIKVRTMDADQRPNESTLTVWVPGGKQMPNRGVTQEKVVLIPDKKEYRPGDTAQILVQAPFYPCEGVLTLRRTGLLETRRFSVEGPSTVLKVPIVSGHIPNLYAQVDLDGQNKREDGDASRPAYATGQIDLRVPPFERTLAVEVKPLAASLDPGSDTSIAVKVNFADGSPAVNSEVALVMVDEAVLALTGYQIANPVDTFYANREPGVTDAHSRESVLLVDLSQLANQAADQTRATTTNKAMALEGAPSGGAVMDAAPAPSMDEAESATDAFKRESGGRGGDDLKSQPQVKLRTNFNALAVFAPHVKVGGDGTAVVKVKLPDSLTRYRVVAVAVADGDDFGKGEASVTARLPLMVRPSPPRFLNFGDRCELPVVVQNQTDKPMDVQVVVRAQNATLSEGQGCTFQVAANDRAEVRFPVSTESAGTAAFQVGAFSGNLSDASDFQFPVWTPATTEAFATYGNLDTGATAQPVKAPGEVWTQFGGLEVTTSSTALAELTDAMIYLASYPYECSEQISSRVLGIVSLRDVLTAFKTKELPDPLALVGRVQLDIERLRTTQRSDGGFGFWSPDEDDFPYLSVHVGHALVRARLKGFKVPEEMLTSNMSYLRNVEAHIPSWYGEECRRSIIAYALWTRFLNGDKDVARAKQLVAEAGGADKLPLEALGWILPLLSQEPEAAAIRRHLDNRVVETAEAANFTESYGENGPYVLLSSDRRVDAVLLEALILDSPKSDLIPKLVRGLLSHRTAGRWSSTQENVFVLLAMDRYFNTYEKTTPDFVARVWLGQQYAGEQGFHGRSPDRKLLEVPMGWLAGKGEQSLVIAKDGPGRLYYRIGMRYAPRDLVQEPADQGFTVERTYEGVDAPSDVTRDAEGVWTMKAGARVRVRLTMAATNRRYHVALVDPLPAGLEAMNPALAVTGHVPADPKTSETGSSRYWYWMMPWYEHQNMRDERVEAFTSLLWDGVYTYSYVARATTPGTFVVPPTKAEEMYNPETFGRSASDRVVVK